MDMDTCIYHVNNYYFVGDPFRYVAIHTRARARIGSAATHNGRAASSPP
jgi:hypothetical protein